MLLLQVLDLLEVFWLRQKLGLLDESQKKLRWAICSALLSLLTYKLSELATLSYIVEEGLIEEAQYLPSLECLNQVLLIVDILCSNGALEHKPNHVVDIWCEVTHIGPLDVFQNVVHHMQVHELALRVLPSNKPN